MATDKPPSNCCWSSWACAVPALFFIALIIADAVDASAGARDLPTAVERFLNSNAVWFALVVGALLGVMVARRLLNR